MPQVPGQPVDYLTLIEQDKQQSAVTPPAAPGPSSNPYLSMLEQEKRQRDASARATALAASAKDPDQYADTLRTAREAGLPVGAVETDPDAVKADLRVKRLSQALATSPLLQAWAQQDENAILAMDDFENLSVMEKALRSVVDVAAAPARGLYRGLGSGVAGLGDLVDSLTYGGLRLFGETRERLGAQQTGAQFADEYMREIEQAPWWLSPSSILRGLGGFVGQGGLYQYIPGVREMLAPLPEDRRSFATDVGEGLGNLIGQAVATRLNPTAGVALMAGQGAHEQAERAAGAGADASDKAAAVVLGATITGAVEKLGLDLLLDRVPPKVKHKAVQWIVDKAIAGGIEGVQEGTEQVMHNIVAGMLYEPDAPVFAGVADQATVGGAVGFIARSLLGIRSRGYEGQHVKAEQTTLDGLVQVAQASRLNQRMPEKFAEAIDNLAGKAQHVYVPAEAVQTLYQGMEPAQVAAEIGVPVQEYVEAALTGGDVAIPTGAYLSRVAPQHHEALREVARFTPGSLTPAEAAAMEGEAAAAAERFRMSVEAETAQASDRRIYEDVYGMLLGTGRYRREDVEKYALLMQAGFRTLGQRTGQDAFELYSRYRLRIKSELPTALQRIDVDTVIDPLIERLRAGDIPSAEAAYGPSLVEALAARGGVRDDELTGELRRLAESDRAVRAGKPRLVREDAKLTLDYAREAMVEAGYLPDDADINTLLELLDNEMAGRPVRSERNRNEELAGLRESLLALDEELGRRGIPLDAPNDQIKRALFGEGGQIEVPDALVKVFDQSAPGPSSELQRALAMSEDDYIAAVNPSGKRLDADDRVRLLPGDLDVPANATRVATFTDKQGRRGEILRDETGAMTAVVDGEAVGLMSALSEDETVIDVVEGYQGSGIGVELAKAYIRENPFALSGGFTAAGEATRRAAFRALKRENAVNTTSAFYQSGQPDVSGLPDTITADEQGRPLVVYHGTSLKNLQGILKKGLVPKRKKNHKESGDYVYVELSARTARAWARQAGGKEFAVLEIEVPESQLVRDSQTLSRSSFRTERIPARLIKGWDVYRLAPGSGDLEYVRSESNPGFRPEQIKSATGNRGTFDPNGPNILHQRTADADAAIRRGYIQFNADRHFTIGLLEKADATTFLHEAGHFFLEVLGDLATAPDAPADIVADYQSALKWLGVESREQIGVEQHEKWARGFEAYLGEGKAPSAELTSVFARFKAWVKAIYRTLRNLNVQLDDDIRKVFDRLLAADEEITQAEASMDYAPLFKDAAAAGWSEAEFQHRLRLNDEAREEAEAKLMARAMRDVKRETRAWWKEREAEVREAVTREVYAMPVYRAWSALANNTQPDGTPLPTDPIKLDKGWLVRQYGQEWLNKHLLRKRVYAVEGGIDPDVAAELFGFDSGDALVKALANAQPMESLIAAETRARMIDQYGDVLTDGTMPELAMRAVHSDRRFKALEADLRALERLMGEPRPSAPQMRRIAEAIIGAKKVRALQPYTYLRAERKAAKEAVQAAGRGEYGKALEAQRRRLLNAHLFDVASRAKDESEKLRRYVLRFRKPALRAKLGKIDRLEQVEAILDGYDLARRSGAEIDRNKAAAELLQAVEAGTLVAPRSVIDKLRNKARTNWMDLTVEELRGLRDVLRQIEVAARAEYEVMVNDERVQLDEVADAIAASTSEGGKPVMPIYGELAPEENVKRFGRQALASWLRPSSLARLLDGGKDDGAWTRHVIQPIRRAVAEKLEPMKREAQEKLADLYRRHYTVAEMAAMNERRVVPGLGMSLSRWDLISLALNWGNAENRKAVLDSEVAGRRPFTEAGVRTALEQLDARDWAFVQDAWDLIDGYWPQIKEAQRRRKGIAPPKVEADPFTITTRAGQRLEIKGGYYPLKYNSRLDARARQHEMDDAFERMRAGTMSAVQTKYGHTQERVGSGRQPVLLSMNVLHSHLNNVVMDLALGDAVIYVDKVLRRPQVRKALIETGNLDALETFKLWLKDVAVGEMGARSGAEQIAQFVRFGFTKSKIGFNAMTVALQVTGLTQSMAVVGSQHVAAAAMDMAGRPRQAIAQVMAESAFMRTRYELNAFNKDIAAVQEALRSGGPDMKGRGFIGGFVNAVRAVQLPPRLVNWAFFGIRQVQILVDTVTWLAGYRKAVERGMSHREAVLYADGVVENAQTSGMFSDRSAIERGTFSETTRQSEFVKLWTALGSYMIAKGNIAFESAKRTDFRSPTQVLKFGADMGLLFAAELILMAALKGGLPDDDEDWWWWVLIGAGEQALSTIPIVREIPGLVKGYGTSGGPLGATMRDIAKAAQQTEQGEVDAALIKSYVNLIGTATGLPSAQANRAIDAYWRDHVEGEDVPPYEYVIGKREG